VTGFRVGIGHVVAAWVVLMIAGGFAAGCAYLVFQQAGRDQANQPAAAAASQAVYELASGKPPADALPASTDMTSTLTPFVLIFDTSRRLVASSGGTLDSALVYPASCFDQVDASGENRVTWQPEPGLRFATVAVKYDGGYVVGAYSLAESERDTGNFGTTLAIGYGAYACGCALVAVVCGWFMRARRPRGQSSGREPGLRR